MPIDTSRKRQAIMLNSAELVRPDGTIDLGDRMALLGLYPGPGTPDVANFTRPRQPAGRGREEHPTGRGRTEQPVGRGRVPQPGGTGQQW